MSCIIQYMTLYMYSTVSVNSLERVKGIQNGSTCCEFNPNSNLMRWVSILICVTNQFLVTHGGEGTESSWLTKCCILLSGLPFFMSVMYVSPVDVRFTRLFMIAERDS